MSDLGQEGPPGPGLPLTRRRQALEALVFLFLIVPSITFASYTVTLRTATFVQLAGAVILRDLALVSLILYFVWSNREPLEGIGWTWRGAGRDALLGLAVFPLFFFGAGLLQWALINFGFTVPNLPQDFLRPEGAFEYGVAVLLVAVVAVSEETIFRGYLIRRFRGAGAGPVAAVLISSAIFAVGHGYEGSAGLLTVAAMGLAFALLYLWRRSLAAPTVVHFLQDFTVIVLMPLLGIR